MKLAVMNSIISHRKAIYPLTWERAIEKFADAGFRYTDYGIHGDFMSGDSPLLGEGWRAFADGLRERFNRRGVEVVQSHSVFYNFFDGSEQSEYFNSLLPRNFEISARLGAMVTVMHPIAPPGLEYDRDRTRIANRDFFRRQAESAAKYGVRIAVENMLSNRLFDGTIFKRCCTSSEELYELVEEIDCENVGICIDTGHVLYMEEDIPSALRRCAKYLIALHMHDNDTFNDSHVPPYCGCTDWEAVYRTLGEINYQGNGMLEIIHFCERMPEELEGDALKYAAKLTAYMEKRINEGIVQ